MPDCAAQKKTAAQCGDELYASMMVHMGNIVDAVHEANPQAKVVGFGYDTMFGGLGCALVTHELFPQCFGLLKKGGNACFNTQFLRIQQVWHDTAANRSWVDEANILRATQVAVALYLSVTESSLCSVSTLLCHLSPSPLLSLSLGSSYDYLASCLSSRYSPTLAITHMFSLKAVLRQMLCI